jgi:L-rhamnose-H+ transport protein
MTNPITGVFYHWLGGIASASFYVPYRGVRRWSWEIYWITGGIFSWAVAPWLFAFVQTENLMGVFAAAPRSTILWPIFFGILWGFGGLTYGLTMRYLGLSLGMAVVLGLCTVFGTLIPPIFNGDFVPTLLGTTSGKITLFGLAVTHRRFGRITKGSGTQHGRKTRRRRRVRFPQRHFGCDFLRHYVGLFCVRIGSRRAA